MSLSVNKNINNIVITQPASSLIITDNRKGTTVTVTRVSDVITVTNLSGLQGPQGPQGVPGLAVDTGSFFISASVSNDTITFTLGNSSASLVTVNNVQNTQTASYVLQAVSASFAQTASYVNPLNQNVIITGSIYIPDNNHSIYFSGSSAASRLVWNDTDGTLDLGLKGGNVTLQIGQEQVVRVVNKTGANLLESEYKVARIRRVDEGGAQGQRLAIVLAQANNDANSVDTLGIVTENINDNQEGFITNSGLVRGINTTGTLQGETWVDGDVLYLSPTTPGALTTVKPQAPNHTVIMGYVVYVHNNQGKIFVKVDNGYEIDELHNVRITTASLAAGQLLVRSGSNATGVWINTNQLTGSYSITGSLTISGSSTFTNIGPAIFSGSVSSNAGFTGSLQGTASYAIQSQNAVTASYILNAVSSSFASTASYALNAGTTVNTGSLLTTASISNATITFTKGDGTTFPVTVNNVVSASYAVTASYLTGYVSPFPFTGSAIISGSLTVTGSTNLQGSSGTTILSLNADTLIITGSLTVTGSINVIGLITGTASLALQSQTASYVLNAISSSYAATASYAFNTVTASYTFTASYIDGGFY